MKNTFSSKGYLMVLFIWSGVFRRYLRMWFECEVFVSQFKFPVCRQVYFMVICDVTVLSQFLKRSAQRTILHYNRKCLSQICVRSMYIYLHSQDADCNRRFGNARQRTDVIISHQTLQKQTWRHVGNLKIYERRIKMSRIQTSYRDVG